MIDSGRRAHNRRVQSAYVLSDRLEDLGSYHPGTWAALARAHKLWGGFVRPVHIESETTPELAATLHEAYTTADLRNRGVYGWNNRAMRRARRRRRCDDQACTNNLIDLLPRGVMPGGTRMPA